MRHPLEAWRASGTARIAELALQRCRVVSAAPPYESVDRSLAGIGDAWLLFPGGPDPDRLGTPPRRLVVLDGTWREVRRLLRKLPSLWKLPRLALPPKAEAPLRLRHSPLEDRRSTLEAIADALALLEGEQTAAPLAELHARFVEHSLKARGAWSYRGSG